MKSGTVVLASLEGYWAVVSIKVVCRTGVSIISHLPSRQGSSKCKGKGQH